MRSFLYFLGVRRPEHVIPKPARDAEVNVGVLMMNDVVGPQPAIPGIPEIEVVMNVMKEAIENKSGKQSCEETQNKMEMQAISEHVPYESQKRTNYEPGHGNQHLR